MSRQPVSQVAAHKNLIKLHHACLRAIGADEGMVIPILLFLQQTLRFGTATRSDRSFQNDILPVKSHKVCEQNIKYIWE